MALADLIRLNKHRIRRKAYIKRRLVDGSYESSWYRFDNYNGRDRVIDWGEVAYQLDEQPGLVGAFEISAHTMIVDNNEGLFNIETYPRSLWAPEAVYLNRRYTLLKIDTCYLDETDAEIGEATDFEGLIDAVTLSEDGTATITTLSYQSLFTKYPIADLSLTGEQTITQIVAAICNQAKITDYLAYNAPSFGQSYSYDDASVLEGTYWDILQEIAYKSSSTITLTGSTFKIEPRVGGSVVWNFKGSGAREPADIMAVNMYDDEGIGKVRVYWKEEDGATSAISSDATLLLKYLSEPELVDLTNVKSTDKQGVVDALLTKWETNRPIINFDTKYMINSISLLDKITLEIRGRITPGDGTNFWWGAWTWGDGSVWGEEVGGIIIASGTEWFVTMILKSIQTGRMTIQAEKVT